MPQNPLQELVRATEKNLEQNRSTLDWLYAKRFWLVVAILATLFVPVLQNRVNNQAALSRSGEWELTGYDVLTPTIGVTRNGYVVGSSWCVNPFAAVLYLSAGVMAYVSFVGKTLSPKLEIPITGAMVVCALTLPLTHLPVCDVMIPSFWCKWYAQPVLWGWYVLSAASVALFLSIWAQRLPSSNASATTSTLTGESK